MADKKPFYVFKSKLIHIYRPELKPNGSIVYKKGKYLINKNKAINYNYFKSKIKTNYDFNPSVEDGLYTWVLKKSDNFYTAKINEGQEIGTLHNNIFVLTYDDDPSNIQAAGEIEKIGDKLTFNFSSGTYMKDDRPITDQLIKQFIEKLESFGWSNINYSGTTTSFINLENDRLKPSANRLEKLNTMYTWTNLGGKRRTKRNRVKRRKTHKK
jgi:hypothetical protein